MGYANRVLGGRIVTWAVAAGLMSYNNSNEMRGLPRTLYLYKKLKSTETKAASHFSEEFMASIWSKEQYIEQLLLRI